MNRTEPWWRTRVAGRLPLPDVALAVAFGVLMAVELVDLLGRVEGDAPAVVPAVIVAAMVGAVATRRLAPMPSYAVNGIGLMLYVGLGYPGEVYPWSNLVVLYSVARFGTRAEALGALLFGALGIAWYFTVVPGPVEAVDPIFVAGAFLTAWVAGQVTAARRSQAAAEERERAHVAASIVAAERTRMARELHDVVGHALNVIVMHAGAGRRLVGRDAAAVEEALSTVEATGRHALEELDHVLGLLGDTDEGAPTSPGGIAGLATVCDRVSGAGLGVDLTVAGPVERVPATVSLAVHRIVQEALTNVVKHARATRVEVAVVVGSDAVEVEVVDDGRGPVRAGRPGRGLAGLAERVEVLGGDLVTGPVPGGGWRVRGAVPLGAPR